MKKPKPIKPQRRLVPTKFVQDIPVAGRCSICHRPFEVNVPSDTLEELLAGRHRLLNVFEKHTCDVNQAAAADRRDTNGNP